MDDLRHAEYYDMQSTIDSLYARGKAGEHFRNLMGFILTRENILLAYRNIKNNTGSNTPGTDKLTIKDIGKLTPDEILQKVRFIVSGSEHGYRPKPVRRKDIPKPNDPTKTRPLGIPCIWDRLIQQCIKQILEPICESKFSDNSHGFRPGRSVEHAISRAQNLIQLSHMYYVIEFDIKGFFDNVNHSKLIRQLWAMGIQDKHLLFIIKRILKAPIKMPDGSIMHPNKGTPQGGIISPLLANVVLNELDHWIESQWQENPVINHYKFRTNKAGMRDKGSGYRAMRGTQLKEMYIVRYADDFRIFCRTKGEAERSKTAITQWLEERLKLEVSPEKTRIINVKRQYMEFLGFKMKTHFQSKKRVVKSHICDKKFEAEKVKLIEQVKNIVHPRGFRSETDEIRLYNAMVMGIQNYYSIATNINLDCARLQRAVMTVLTNRLRAEKSKRLKRTGRLLTKTERDRYGTSEMLRFGAGTGEPIYPIGKVKHKTPHGRMHNLCF